MDIPCPSCDAAQLEYSMITLDIPYFGELVQTTLLCKKCEYKHNDVMIADLGGPMRHEMIVDSEKDMSVKVVRSASGTVSVPELGMKVEPGVASDGYISNVEGVLSRFRDAVEMAIRFAKGKPDEEGSQKKGQEVLDAIQLVIDGKMKITLIVEDPFGKSAIISDKTSTRKLTEEEAKALNSGFSIFEAARTIKGGPSSDD